MKDKAKEILTAKGIVKDFIEYRLYEENMKKMVKKIEELVEQDRKQIKDKIIGKVEIKIKKREKNRDDLEANPVYCHGYIEALNHSIQIIKDCFED